MYIFACIIVYIRHIATFLKGAGKKKSRGKLQLIKVVKPLIRGGGSGGWEGVAYFTHVPRASISLLISFLLRLFLIVDGQTSYSLTFLHVYLRKLVVARKSAPNHPMLLAYT